MRNAFIKSLVEAAERNENIALMVGDLGYGVVEPFAERFPKRFFNAGVAEQNMIGVAAGLAAEGCHVFVYSIANFSTFRCAEQIRNDVDYHKLPVTVVSVGGGVGYGNLGYSHHAIQDYGLMRLFPNIQICAPGDPLEVDGCVSYLARNPQPSYLRIGKAGEPVYTTVHADIEPGRWYTVRESRNLCRRAFVTTGYALDTAMKLTLLKEFSDWAVLTVPIWGMRSKQIQLKQFCDWDAIVTLEDHLEDGGFGSWMSEAAMATPQSAAKLTTIGFKSSVCGVVASQAKLHEVAQFDVASISRRLAS